MPLSPPAVSPISLVVRWPANIPAASAGRLFRILDTSGTEATWAIEQPDQVGALVQSVRRAVAPEIGLLTSASTQEDAEAIERGLERFDLAGQRIAGIWSDDPIQRGTIERRLAQVGAGAIITAIKGKSSTVRQLPFGVWGLGSHIRVPVKDRWRLPFLRRTARLLQAGDSSPTIATIDLERAASCSSQGWSEVQRFVHDAAMLCEQRIFRSITIGQLSSELSGSVAARPQRSILRMAA